MHASRLAKSHRRLHDILEDIDNAVGLSRALDVVEASDNLPVPFALRRAIGRTALFMLQEAETPEQRKARRARRKAEYEAYKKSVPEGEKPLSQRAWRHRDNPKQRERRLEKERENDKRRRAKKRSQKAPGASGAAPQKRSRGGGGPRPPAPPAAGAQAVGGDAPTPARKRKDKKVAAPGGVSPDQLAKIKQNKKRSKLPPERDDYQGLPRRKAVTQGTGNEKKDASTQDKIAARFKKAIAKGKTSAGVREKIVPEKHKLEPRQGQERDQHWYDRHDELEPWRYQSPEDHAAHLAKKLADLAELEKDRQRRGHFKSLAGRAGHLARTLAKHPGRRHPSDGGELGISQHHGGKRKRHIDVRKGYDPDENQWGQKPKKDDQPDSAKRGGQGAPKANWKGHAVDPDTGEVTHSSGNKDNKKFANRTTFGNSDDDAMLHTDKDEKGARGSAKEDEFAVKGKKLSQDPRQKWFRVSRQGGYASAMGSLGAAYHGDADVKSKVTSKVRSTGFTDSKGHQIDVRPTGHLHDERPECKKGKDGELSARGKALKARDKGEFYRLCKGVHGPADEGARKASSAARNEYQRGFDPQHDSASKLKKLHKAAERGKAKLPDKKIAARKDRRAARQARG